MKNEKPSLHVSPRVNGSPSPDPEMYNLTEKLMFEMKLRLAKMEESKKEEKYINEPKDASNAEISKLSNMVQEETKTSSSPVHHAADENSTLIPSQMCTVDDLIKTETEKLNYKFCILRSADGTRLKPKYPALHVFVINKFDVQPSYHTPMLSHIIYNNISILSLIESTISYSEYKKLISSSNLQQVQIWSSNIIDESGKKMDVADLLKEIPKIECFVYDFKNGAKRTSRITQKLSQLPPFSNLEQIRILNIQSDFDLESFGRFIKQNPKASFELEFKCSSEIFAKIKSIEKDLIPTLPSTCELEIKDKNFVDFSF